jgi:putative mRNA 3-end processing factor
VALLELTDHGFYCETGDFFIDPWQPVDRAVITHAHSDHLRPGSRSYLLTSLALKIARRRLGFDAPLQSIDYGAPVTHNGVKISLHPAGHILGSAQVRIEHRGEVAVFSGDWKRHNDPTCSAFELLPCHTFITEATFGLPIYRWPSPEAVFQEINEWWVSNQKAGRASVLLAYALGKAQRILAGIDATIGPIYLHGAVHYLNEIYRSEGLSLPQAQRVVEMPKGTDWRRALIVAPPSAYGSLWMRRFGAISVGFASGWMRVRGVRRRRAIDRGFILSDHTDWPALIETINATGAETIGVTHGYVAVVARWLAEQGKNAIGYETRFEGETVTESPETDEVSEGEEEMGPGPVS